MTRSIALAALAALSPIAARAEVPHVVADIAPVHSLVAQVMGDLGAPDLLLPPGASPHSYSMRPSEAANLERADVVVWVGEALSPWLAGPVSTLSVNALTVRLLDVDGTHRMVVRWGEEDHADDHGDDHADGHADEGHSHAAGSVDPHVWLDPANALHWLDTIAVDLAETDLRNAAAYVRNSQAARAELMTVRDELKERLKPLEDVDLILYHDATQYFETAFGLHAVGAMTLGDTAPSPRHLAELSDTVAGLDHACIVMEVQADPGLADAVKGGSDAKVVTLDLQGSTLEPGPGFYAALLRGIADTLEGCL